MNIFLVDKKLFLKQSLQLAIEQVAPYRVNGHSDCLAGCMENYLVGVDTDLIVFDLDQEIYHLDWIVKIRNQNPGIQFLAYANEVSRSRYLRLIHFDIRGCVLKSASLSELFQAISTILSGRISFPDQVIQQNIILSTQPHHFFEDNLTEREYEILQYLVEGLSSKEVAQKLHLSYDTVKWHRNNLLVKTGCKNMVSLYKYAIHQNWVQLP